MTPLARPLTLRAHAGASAHRVTWLELFHDLIFVAAVAQVAEPLRHHYEPAELLRFVPLFALIWWAWVGHAVFATRFTADDVVQRVLTLLQVFIVAAMAANADEALSSRSTAGFAAAYAALRFVLVAQYARVREGVDATALARRFMAGHGAAAVLWLASSALPSPARYVVWALAFAIDLGTPWVAVAHSARVPPGAAHLPERFGLFTLILLGEAVIAVMHGMKSQDTWTPLAATAAISGMATVFVFWWWYFEGAEAAAERHVRTRRDVVRLHAWTYGHFPLYLGIVLVGVGIQQVVTAAGREPLNVETAAMLISGAVLVVAAIGVMQKGQSKSDNRPLSSSVPVS